MKNATIALLCLLSHVLFAHNPQDNGPAATRHWTIAAQNQTIDGSFYLYKDDVVFIEQANHEIAKIPLSGLSAADQAFVRNKNEQIKQLNNLQPAATTVSSGFDVRLLIAGLLVLLLGGLFYALAAPDKRKYLYPVVMVGLAALLFNFTRHGAKPLRTVTTNPAFIDSAFTPFKPKVYTHWDANYFYVESKGIPDHPMMTGIVSWQQQVPIPQCYTGANAWSIPLNPVIAATPVPVSPQHFTRGAIAIAANGVAIFNLYTNTGVDAKVDGQLDNWGGHCGRADDYHYHIAPLTLYSQTSPTLPIAFALDGFAVYGAKEPDGSDMSPLDANHGHYGTNGVYHYHGTETFPYMIGNMVGQVTEDNTMQIIPQAAAHPVRPSLTPLQGAKITDCQPNASNNGYVLTYTKGGQTYKVDYNWTQNGKYTFKFISPPSDTATSIYNGFSQCQVPVGVDDLFANSNSASIYPNPAHGSFSVLLTDVSSKRDVRDISIYHINGELVRTYQGYQPEITTGGWAAGVYLVKIRFAKNELVKKLVIE
jgi:hypothetical protein